MDKAAKPNADSDATNWSEAVEDLVEEGRTEVAISLLESVVSKLETQGGAPQADLLQLSSALGNLAELYSSQGFSLKADDLRSRSALLKESASGAKVSGKELVEDSVSLSSSAVHSSDLVDKSFKDGHNAKSVELCGDATSTSECLDDDWEAIADRAPDELLPSQCLPGVSNLSIDDTKVHTKRRGRGTFTYKKNELYSDRVSDNTAIDDAVGEDVSHNSEEVTEKSQQKYGTRHALVLSDFSLSVKTMDLERLFEDFKDRGFVIRWVNDTCALAVFRTPAIALEAFNRIQCSFKVRILNEDDEILSSVPVKDLEPPRPRPQTSARTAQRLIAQGMGLKLQPTAFGSTELKKQEAARRNRIVTRQKLRDDAWGSDDLN